jgi:hypothetical protein
MDSKSDTGLPVLPCPHCDADVLACGFFNHATETMSVREDHTFTLVNGLIDVGTEEDERKSESFDSDSTACCSNCHKSLPWSSRELKELDGCTMADVVAAVAHFIQQNYARNALSPAATASRNKTANTAKSDSQQNGRNI